MKIAEPVQSECEVSVAMTTMPMAQGRIRGRQHKNSSHCEEARRGNLPYFLRRLTGGTHIVFFCGVALFALAWTNSTMARSEVTVDYKAQALFKINSLESLMDKALSQSICVAREESLLWFAKEFLKFADWDEANRDAVEFAFAQFGPYKEDKAKYAEELPDFERKKVIEILDRGILNLEKLLRGEIKRRPVSRIDWQNIVVGDNMLLCQGKPVFLFDYFSKSVGRPLTDTQVYNDHLGSIYHGGSRLYAVDQDRAVNPFLLSADRSFDEEKLAYITEIPDTHAGFLLLWNSGVPEWITAAEPEATRGRSLFTGFDVDNPLVRDVWGQIIRKTGEITRGKKVTQLGYILSNEPHWFSEKEHWTQKFKEMNSISSYTLQKFRDWLRNKYRGRIGELNKSWESTFQNFDTVTIAIPMSRSLRGTPLSYDWCRFNMDRGIDWFTFLQNELHKTHPEAHTHIKIMPRMFTGDYRSHGIDLEALTELTTMIGDDAKATGGRGLRTPHKPEKWEARYAYHWEELAHAYDFMESVAPDKIHVNSETHFISTSQWKDLETSPDYIRSVFWLATLHGMDAGISWFWARDPDGSPEERLEGDLDFFDPALAGSYAGSANMQPQTVNEVAQVMMDLNSFSAEIIALRNQRRPLRLFHSETSAINKPYHMTEQFEIYEALYFEGFPMGFVTEKILNKQDHRLWEVVLVYRTEYVTDAEFDALQRYLHRGGTVLVDSEQSLSKNEYGAPRTKTLTSGRGTLIRLRGKATLSQLKERALACVTDGVSDVALIEENGTDEKGCTWRIVKKADSGFLMNILNIGKNSAQLKVQTEDGVSAIAIDMLTGQTLGSEFELRSKGVLLLEIQRADTAQVFPLSDPDNEGGWIYNAEVSDEFNDAKVNEDRWYIVGKFEDGKPTYKHPDKPQKKVWKGRAPAQFSGRNYRLADGKLMLQTRWEPDFPFSDEIRKPVFGEAMPYENITAACFISRKSFQYGYIEIRSKAADAQVTSGFWSMGRGIEFDFFEQYGDGRGKAKAHLDSELWWSIRDWKSLRGKPAYTERKDLGFRVADAFHVYGIEWDETGIQYYVDGQLFSSVNAEEATAWAQENRDVDEDYNGYVATVPINLWLDMEIFHWHGIPRSKADLELNSPEGEIEDGIVEFEIDYVRVWQKKTDHD